MTKLTKKEAVHSALLLVTVFVGYYFFEHWDQVKQIVADLLR